MAAAPQGDTSDIRRGHSLVETNCASCHAIGREGASPLKGAPAFRDLHRRYPVEHLEEALAEGIITGHASMPEFKFEPKQVDEVTDYIKS